MKLLTDQAAESLRGGVAIIGPTIVVNPTTIVGPTVVATQVNGAASVAVAVLGSTAFAGVSQRNLLTLLG